jgi:hypothetical protein
MSAVKNSRFSKDYPLRQSCQIAKCYKCDLAVPNGPGLGNIVCYTRLAEDLGRRLGRPLRVLTRPQLLVRGNCDPKNPTPVWNSNPFIERIVSCNEDEMGAIIAEKDDMCQFGHIIENLCATHCIRPSNIRGSIFLTARECKAALKLISHLPRPVVALHPGGKTSSPKDSPWYLDRWKEIVERWQSRIGFLQLGLRSVEDKELGAFYPELSIRQSIAAIWACDGFLGFDSGFAHVATAFEKPAAVLWDATLKEDIERNKETGFAIAHLLRWGYPQNLNLIILGERQKEILEACSDFIDRISRSFDRKIYLPNLGFNVQ